MPNDTVPFQIDLGTLRVYPRRAAPKSGSAIIGLRWSSLRFGHDAQFAQRGVRCPFDESAGPNELLQVVDDRRGTGDDVRSNSAR